MAGHSILYLGRSEFAPDFLQQLRLSPSCERFRQSDSMRIPEYDIGPVDVVLFEAGPGIVRSGQSLAAFVHQHGSHSLIALTTHEHEHRGIAAVQAGAQGYICVDDADPEQVSRLIEHAIHRHALMMRLSEADSTVLSILNSINDGVIIVDDAGTLLDINAAGRSILGMSPRELPSRDWAADFGSLGADGQTTVASRDLPLARAGRGEKFTSFIAVYRAGGQGDITLNINGQGLYDNDGNRLGGVVTFRDVTDIMARKIKLEKEAQYDELTRLPNRRLFIHQLEKAIGRAQRAETPLAVLMIDIDKLKSINDTLGHDTGDALLSEMAIRLSRNLRIGDFSGRWGGDEFVVCVEDIDDPQTAAAIAQKIVLLLSERYELQDSEVYATPSIGIAIYPESGETAERMITAAETALGQAKQRGGGRFQFFSASLNRKLQQREELEVGLRHALVRDEFVLHYQPRIDVGSGRLIGLEALLRWQHPRFGLLPPARFLSILESSGLIHSAGEWVIESAFRQLAAWQHQFELPDLSVAIKLSPVQLRHGRLVEAVRKALSDSMLDPGCVEFEIADGVIIRQRSAELETLHGLRKLGLRLSLDHFGTTEVSLNALDTGVIDSFVLDQSLIQDIDENDSHQRIVRAAIAMARGLDIEVAADGVETMTQLEYLKNCQCDLAQGFLISGPVKADKVPAILRSEIAGMRLLQRDMP
jgi:diguanylate cyclase (GGDEF)-like protein/PAS domain S-box-containing protein